MRHQPEGEPGRRNRTPRSRAVGLVASRRGSTRPRWPRWSGRGEGLTPLGDDVVCGWLAAHRGAGTPTPEVDDAVRRLLPRTTTLSASSSSAPWPVRSPTRSGTTSAPSVRRLRTARGAAGVVRAQLRSGPGPRHRPRPRHPRRRAGRMSTDHVELRSGAYADSVTLLPGEPAGAAVARRRDGPGRDGDAAEPRGAGADRASRSPATPPSTTSSSRSASTTAPPTGPQPLAAVDAALTADPSDGRRHHDRPEAPPRRRGRRWLARGDGAGLGAGRQRRGRGDGRARGRRRRMVFSDHVPVEQEVALKRARRGARRAGDGPDCGTAGVDGVGLGFANVVPPDGSGSWPPRVPAVSRSWRSCDHAGDRGSPRRTASAGATCRRPSAVSPPARPCAGSTPTRTSTSSSVVSTPPAPEVAAGTHEGDRSGWHARGARRCSAAASVTSPRSPRRCWSGSAITAPEVAGPPASRQHRPRDRARCCAGSSSAARSSRRRPCCSTPPGPAPTWPSWSTSATTPTPTGRAHPIDRPDPPSRAPGTRSRPTPATGGGPRSTSSSATAPSPTPPRPWRRPGRGGPTSRRRRGGGHLARPAGPRPPGRGPGRGGCRGAPLQRGRDAACASRCSREAS